MMREGGGEGREKGREKGRERETMVHHFCGCTRDTVL